MGRINQKPYDDNITGNEGFLISDIDGSTKQVKADKIKDYVGSGTTTIQILVPYSTGNIAEDFNVAQTDQLPYTHRQNNVVEVYYDDDNNGGVDFYKIEGLEVNSTYGYRKIQTTIDMFVKVSVISDHTLLSNIGVNTHTEIDEKLYNLEHNQITGVETYSTYIDLPITGVLLVSYKVTNDYDTSLNGFYHWDGTEYIKDFSTGEGEAKTGSSVDFVNVFCNWYGDYSSPITTPISLNLINSVYGGMSAVVYKGSTLEIGSDILDPSSIITHFNNDAFEPDVQCTIWFAYSALGGIHITVESGFTGNPLGAPNQITINNVQGGSLTIPNQMTINNVQGA